MATQPSQGSKFKTEDENGTKGKLGPANSMTVSSRKFLLWGLYVLGQLVIISTSSQGVFHLYSSKLRVNLLFPDRTES